MNPKVQKIVRIARRAHHPPSENSKVRWSPRIVVPRQKSRRLTVFVGVGAAAAALLVVIASISGGKKDPPIKCDGLVVLSRANSQMDEAEFAAKSCDWRVAASKANASFETLSTHAARRHACNLSESEFNRIANRAKSVLEQRTTFAHGRLTEAEAFAAQTRQAIDANERTSAARSLAQAQTAADAGVRATDANDPVRARAERILARCSSMNEEIAELARQAEDRKRRDPEEVRRRYGDAVVRIEVLKKDGVNAGIGTGFLVRVGDETMVLTNRHVIEDARTISARFSNKQDLTMDEAYVSDRVDLALLRARVAGRMPAVLSTLDVDLLDDAAAGTDVAALGFPGGPEGIKVEVGDLEGYTDEGGARYANLSVDVSHGHSGGPVIDLITGKVIGMTTFKSWGAAEGLALAPSEIHHELSKAVVAIARKAPRPSRSSSPSPVDAFRKP